MKYILYNELLNWPNRPDRPIRAGAQANHCRFTNKRLILKVNLYNELSKAEFEGRNILQKYLLVNYCRNKSINIFKQKLDRTEFIKKLKIKVQNSSISKFIKKLKN
jgi:hypothetical protein